MSDHTEDAVPTWLIHDEVEPDPATSDLSCLAWADRDRPPAGARVLLCLSDERVREIARMAMDRAWEVGLLPHKEAPQALAALGIKGSLNELLAHYREVSAREVDVLTCNDEIVFSSVVMGKVLALRPYDINRPQTNWSLVKGAFRGLMRLRLSHYVVTTSRDRKLSIAALGLMALGYTQSSLLGRRFSNELDLNEGRLTLLALAPRSVLGYLGFVARLLMPGGIQLNRLPPSLALLQSQRIHVTAPQRTEYLLDGKPVHASEVELCILERRLRLLPGPALSVLSSEAKSRDKETVRMNHVPEGEGAAPLVDKELPLFSHATEDEYRDLFVALRDSASATGPFQVLMILSTLLALTGLYANSAPVIIGAMILAPLMSPVVSLAMGLARTESGLIQSSLRTLAIGIGWALACAVLLAWAMPLEIPTTEMRSRLSPTLLDLLVAVISGAAGAYASAKEEVAKSLAGVAIAVALVPPLSVAGIGLGWGDWAMARGAGLLFITNLVGISLAGSATFLVMGFAPFSRARAGLGVALVLMILISAPLYVAFDHLVESDLIREQVPGGEVELLGVPVSISQVQVRSGETWTVRLVLSAPEPLDHRHVDALKALINKRLEKPVVLDAQFSLRR